LANFGRDKINTNRKGSHRYSRIGAFAKKKVRHKERSTPSPRNKRTEDNEGARWGFPNKTGVGSEKRNGPKREVSKRGEEFKKRREATVDMEGSRGGGGARTRVTEMGHMSYLALEANSVERRHEDQDYQHALMEEGVPKKRGLNVQQNVGGRW